MKKIVFTLLFLISLITSSFSQKSEVGLFLGGSVYSGDLSPQLININFINPAIGGFYRYNLSRHWALRGQVYYGRIDGADSLSKNEFQKNRNLRFKSPLLEFAVLAEFNFLPFETGNKKYPFTPYVFGGISVFHFEPETDFKGDMIGLRQLGTEGQRINEDHTYSSSQVSLPFGIGIKTNLSDRVGIGAEFGVRKTFTDYLDDVSGNYPDFKKMTGQSVGDIAVTLSDRSLVPGDHSGRQRGSSLASDWYTFMGVTLWIKLGRTSKFACTPFNKQGD